LQTGLDSALVTLGTGPSAETFEQISTDFNVSLFRTGVDFLDVLETRVDKGRKLGKGGRQGGERGKRWAGGGLLSEEID